MQIVGFPMRRLIYFFDILEGKTVSEVAIDVKLYYLYLYHLSKEIHTTRKPLHKTLKVMLLFPYISHGKLPYQENIETVRAVNTLLNLTFI